MKMKKIFLTITFLIASSTFAGQPNILTHAGQTFHTYVNRGLAAISNTFSSNATHVRAKMHALGNQLLTSLFDASKQDSEKPHSLQIKRTIIKTTATIGVILAAGGIGWHYWTKNKSARTAVQPQAPAIQPQNVALPFPFN